MAAQTSGAILSSRARLIVESKNSTFRCRCPQRTQPRLRPAGRRRTCLRALMYFCADLRRRAPRRLKSCTTPREFMPEPRVGRELAQAAVLDSDRVLWTAAVTDWLGHIVGNVA